MWIEIQTQNTQKSTTSGRETASATICRGEVGGGTESWGESAWRAEEDTSKGGNEEREGKLGRLRWVGEKEEKLSLEESNGGRGGRGEKGLRRTLEGIGE